MNLTQEQLAALIAMILTNLKAQGKSDSYTTDDIMNEITTALSSGQFGDRGDGEGDDGSDGEDKGTGETGTPEISADLIGQVLDVLKSLGQQKSAGEPGAPAEGSDPGEQKSAPVPGEQKYATPPNTTPAQASPAAPPQRKYSSLFLSTGAARDNSGGSSFKSRLESMTPAQRLRTIYGMFGRAVKCIHSSEGDAEKAAFIAERKFRDAEMAREFKALSATVPADGGYLVPEVYAEEIIELLYPATVIYSLGARRVGMEHGNVTIPKTKSGSRAMFVGENRKIASSSPKFGNLKLSGKKLTALIPMSNDLLRSTSFDNDIIVGQDVTKQMVLGVDYGAILGSGGEFQPLGILNNKKVKSKDVTKLGAEYASEDGKLTAMFPNYIVASVLKDNVLADGLGFIFNTSVEQYFKSIRDNVGGFIFAKEMEGGTLVGYPYRTTNLLPTSDKGKTSIIFGNWNDLMIGEQGALEIETSREGTWTDENGNLVSAFEEDQTLIRAINHVDTGLRHEESFAVATEVSVPV